MTDTLSQNTGVPISQTDNVVSTNITSAVMAPAGMPAAAKQHKTVEMRRKEAEQAIMKTANIKKNLAK